MINKIGGTSEAEELSVEICVGCHTRST